MRNNGTQSVRRALAILRVFDREATAMGVTQLAARVGLHKSTAHRLAATLEAEGFLRRDPASGRYSLGESLYRMAASVVEQDPLLREGRPVLQALRDACGHTVSLGVLDRGQVLFVLVLEATRPIRVSAAWTGGRLPLSVTAAGKVLLAELPREQVTAILRRQGLPRFTPRSLTSREALVRELARVRQEGAGWSREECATGLLALAAPVRADGRTVAAMSVACPTNLVGPENLEELLRRLRRAAGDLSARLSGGGGGGPR